VDHLLLYCDVAYAMWSAIFSRFGLSWVMPLRVFDLFACWWTAGRPRSAVDFAESRRFTKLFKSIIVYVTD
jgi:hypothetical protein